MLQGSDLPDDLERLKGLVIAAQAEAAVVRAAQIAEQLLNEKLRFQIALLKRARYGRSSEQLDAALAQIELTLEDLEASVAALPPRPQPAPPAAKPVRRPLPEQLPREEIVHAGPCACPTCGGALRAAGQDVAEMLEWVPGRYKVLRHVRPKFACEHCETLVQAAAPARPIARGLAGPGLLAHVLVSKYADHLPLYRQSQIFARDGIDLDRSTLADWVGGASALCTPLVDALARYVLGAGKLHADDTPAPVLCPGRGTTRQGRLWTYVRDDRPAASQDPPAVWFQYSPDRKGERPRGHLTGFTGILQADGYAGFEHLYGERLREAACWAHVRRKFYDVHVANASPIAAEALARIGRLYAIEAEIRGRPPDERRAVRQARAGPELEALYAWLHTVLPTLSKKSELAGAIRYALSRWTALTRYRDDGRIELDNNAAERALRAVALGRNYPRAAIMHGWRLDGGGSRARRLRAGRCGTRFGVGAPSRGCDGAYSRGKHNHRLWRNCKIRSGGRYRIGVVLGG